MKSKTTAGILALFLGGLGIHKFYLGQGGMGILYLLFCWTYIPAIAGFIEAIIYFTMNDDQFNMRYNGRLLHTGHQTALYAPQQAAQRQMVQPMAQSVVVNVPGHAGPPKALAGPALNVSDELRKLHELHVAGILTTEEFQTQKRRILGA